MNKGFPLAACLVLIGGCASVQTQNRLPDPTAPKVFLSNKGKIVVDQSPIRVEKPNRGGKVTITWSLPAESDLTFPEKDGVQIRQVPTREQGSPPPFKPVVCGKTQHSGVPELRITAVELDPKKNVKAIAPQDLKEYSCGSTPDRKSFQCSFVPPEERYILKYSIYVCRGEALVDTYDPFIMD